MIAGDFDGDEVNGYSLRNEQDAYECQKLSGTQELLISNGYGSPMIGQCQDGTLGLALLTRDCTKLIKSQVMFLFDNTGLFPEIPNKEFISGREVLTILFKILDIEIDFQTTANIYNKNINKYRHYSETEINVIIKNGEFLSGIIDKS